ncbi:MAG: amidohydrolase family protein [Flavobacteriaceae bacterium]|jgi:imidazolonepropionase-like amidohydrolase|nr:amidohydrolase family protein [Flavobacteriaceae bacterium]MBT3918927.1 amidohydrolase family protein [Flavobacteriaceae bacterium]MBT6704564.1 amidohydrolase family protein [Flavobacteriaceae bacterium]
MKAFKNIISLVIMSFNLVVFAQQTPAPIQNETITISGATAHIGNGTIIKNSIITFENGILIAVADATISKIALKGTIIDATGKHVYPGFIAPNTTLGIVEIDAVRPTRDEDELGEFIPNVRSLIAYNAESKVVESLRPNGVLIAQITPRGGTISGTSSIVQLDAWNWEDAVVKEDDGVHINWPNSYARGRWWLGESSAYKANKNYQEEIENIKSFILNSKTYGKSTPKKINEAFKAMQGLFNGHQKMFVHAQGEKEMIDAVTILKNNGIYNVVVVGAYEAYKISDFLKKNDISVLIQRVHSTPERDDEDYDLPYKLAKLLVDEGILVALQTSGQMEGMNTRNLPFYAGQVAAQGLSKEKALQLITENPAKILGIDANYGTLEIGKSATLFICKGDALDMRTNILSQAFIDGREISLETHQTKLWKRYSEKYSNN